MKNKDLKRRILEISHKHHLSHLGSCLTAVDIIDEIYNTKKSDEPFVLSCGHAGLALYVVIEKYEGINANEIFNHHGVHPDRCERCHIYCSTGSLGHGLPIATGMALADRSRNVYCLISDGECAEGSIQESLRLISELNITNLKVYINWNGWGAYGITQPLLQVRSDPMPIIISQTNSFQFPFLVSPTPQHAHYHVMSDEDYKLGMEILK